MVARQAFVLATADAYRVLGWFALALIAVVLRLQYIPAPTVAAPLSGAAVTAFRSLRLHRNATATKP